MLPSGISVRIREDLIDGVSRVQTTLIIDPIITQGGHRVTMDDIGSIGYGKIDGGGPREEIISWTGITDNTTTYTLTGCVWGINFHNLEASADNTRRHTSGAKFEIKTDMHYITNQFRDNEDNVFTNTDSMEFNSNEIKLGDGTDTLDKIITADNGDVNEPFVKYNETSGKWEISNDGVNSYDPEDGGSGVTAGDGISIIGGEVSVKTKETSGIHITSDEVAIEYQTEPGLSIVDNKLGVKVKANTGLLKDADGIYNDSIDPDNPVAQSASYLTGGTDVTLSNFTTLGAGTNDGKFSINIDGVDYNDVAVDLSTATDEASIAALIQTAIRIATSSLETVAWSTDHFVITSAYTGRSSQVLKLTAPTTGTDISVAGYLDLGVNATETPGAGDDYKLVRLDEDGQVPLDKLEKLVSTCPEGWDVLYWQPREYSQSGTNYGRKFNLKFNRKGYYRFRLWGWGGLGILYCSFQVNSTEVLYKTASSNEPDIKEAPFVDDILSLEKDDVLEVFIKSSASDRTGVIKNFTILASQFTTPIIENI